MSQDTNAGSDEVMKEEVGCDGEENDEQEACVGGVAEEDDDHAENQHLRSKEVCDFWGKDGQAKNQ